MHSGKLKSAELQKPDGRLGQIFVFAGKETVIVVPRLG